MCWTCWDDAFRPHLDTPAVRRAAEMIKRADHYGALHILVEDWNSSNRDIAYCRAQPEITPDEVALLDLLASMSYKQRISALALAEGYWTPQQAEDNP